MEIRNIREQEQADYVRLMRYCFDRWSDDPVKEEDLNHFLPAETFGLFDDEGLAAGLVIRRFRQVVRRSIKPMGGIASVGSYPEGRGGGNVRRLFQHAFRLMREQGRCVSMLHPFRESFYRRLGYMAAPSPLEVAVPTEAFRHALSRDTGDTRTVRAREEGARERYLEWLARPARDWTGFVLEDPVSPFFWQRRLKDAVYLFAARQEEIRGAGCYWISSRQASPQIRFHDILWTDRQARDSMFGFFARHADQIESVRLRLPMDAPIHSWLYDTMKRFVVEIDEKPWMVRIVDLEPALRDVASGDDEIETAIAVEDPLCEWNNGTFLIRSEAGRLRVTRTDAAAAARVDVSGLSALLYGTLDAPELVYRGLLETEAPEVLERLFPPTCFFNSTPF